MSGLPSRKKKETQPQIPDAAPTTDLETTSTIPWPDWTNPERQSVRAITLAPFLSRCPRFPWWERHDLWWSEELFAGGNPLWRKPGKYVWTTTTGVTGKATRRRVHIPEYSGSPSIHSAHVRNVISTLALWHHATTRQLAAMCSHSPTNFSGRILKPLYEAGVVERGKFMTSDAASNMKNDYCYRLRVGEELWRWLDSFNDETWVNLTYGELPQEPAAYVRHNLMAFEAGLRLMEGVPSIVTGFGEHVTSMKKLLDADNRKKGDLGLVRSDGLRIVVELVHEQYREGFSNKIASWAHHLTRKGTVRDHGTIVLFLAAPRRYSEAMSEMRRRFQETLSPEGLRSPSGVAADPNKVANARLHIFLASWPDWFPGPHAASQEFADMTSWKLSPNNQWQSVHLAHTEGVNGYPFKPKDPFAWTLPLEIYKNLYGQPKWAGGPLRYTREDADLLQNPLLLGDFQERRKTLKRVR